MNVLVMYNPAAGGGKESRLQALVEALKAQQLSVEVYHTQHAGDATQYLQQRTKQSDQAYDVVVSVGGDGTTHEVINGMHPNAKLAIYATGTANVLANELGLPRDAKSLAQVIAQGETLPVQFGSANNERFCMWVGVGFDAWVVDQANMTVKRWLGKVAYANSMLVQAFKYGRYRYLFNVDGKEYTTYSAVITHARYYGGKFVLSRQADILSPQLYVLLFQKPGRGFFFKALGALLLGKMESVDGVLALPFEQLKAELLDPPKDSATQQLANAVQADGDVLGNLPIQVALESEKIQVIVKPSLAEKIRKRHAK